MKTHLKTLLAISALALLSPLPAFASDGHGKHKPAAGTTAAAAAGKKGDGHSDHKH